MREDKETHSSKNIVGFYNLLLNGWNFKLIGAVKDKMCD